MKDLFSAVHVYHQGEDRQGYHQVATIAESINTVDFILAQQAPPRLDQVSLLKNIHTYIHT